MNFGGAGTRAQPPPPGVSCRIVHIGAAVRKIESIHRFQTLKSNNICGKCLKAVTILCVHGMAVSHIIGEWIQDERTSQPIAYWLI